MGLNDTCNDYEALKIGALLHDIGKLLERSGYRGSNELHSNSYGHEKAGIKFFSEYFEKFKFGLTDCEKEIIKNIIGMHHSKKNNELLINIVKLADWLSSGERIISKEKIDKDRYNQSLFSVFNQISLNKNKKTVSYNNGKKYDFISLNVSNKVFPKQGYPNRDYDSLFKEFIDEINNNTIDNFEKLFQLMQKYTWCIPSATYWKDSAEYIPDVSLFDHSKTTCAIACCLYKLCEKNIIDFNYIENLLKNLNNESNKIKIILEKYGKEGDNKEDKKEEDKYEKIKEIKKLLENDINYINKPLFSLIHGDISGVQDFIFNIATKGANKSLKGRSFYLDFLTELCAKYVINDLNLPITNILFYGGGHFYILSYNDGNIDKKVVEFEETINKKLYDMFGIDLYVAIGKVDLRPIDFLIDCADEDCKIGIPYKWRTSTEETSKRKLRKFEFKMDDLFEPKEIKKGRCTICKHHIDDKNSYIHDNKNNKICENCASFIEITEFLRDFGKYSDNNTNNNEKNDNNIINYNMERYSRIFNKISTFKELPTIKKFYNMALIENEMYYLPDKNGNLKIPYKIWSIAFPMDENGIKDFSKLGEDAEERTGTNKIAILKMDVDNLGKIITKGLGDYATISRLSTLSSMLTLFFTGYIPYLIKTGEFKGIDGNKYKYEDNIYLTYSGGDDTLIVGAWDAVWELSKEIRNKFKEFVCDNPEITLSAGIVIVNPKYEFRKGVYQAEDELENAKENSLKLNSNEKIEKNSLSVFKLPIFWNDIESESRYEEKYIKAVNKVGKRRILNLSQKVFGNLKRLISIREGETEGIEEEIRINLPYLWRMEYYLYRNYKEKENEKWWECVKFIQDYLDNIKKNIQSGNIDELKKECRFNDIIIASRICELKTRNKDNNKTRDR